MKLARFLPLAAVFCAACDRKSTATTAPLTICDDVLITMRVSPASVTMMVGDSALFTATPPVPGPCVAPLPVPFAVFWRSSNPAVVAVDSATGKSRGVGAGQATVLAIIIADTALRGAGAVQVNPR
jgi:hypothetical protein